MELDMRNEKATIVDHNEAKLINELVNKGLIDVEKVGKAGVIELGEMIVRYGHDIARIGGFDEKGKPYVMPKSVEEKITTLFGNREVKNTDELQKAIEDARKIIEFIARETGLPITGAIVHGSRMDLEKIPRENSDLDICLYVNQRGFDKKPVELKMWNIWLGQLGLPYKVEINEVYDRDNFMYEVDTSKEDTNYVPFWGWNPESFAYVGSFSFGSKNLKDEQATEYLKSKLKSEEMQQRRIRKVQMMEGFIQEIIKSREKYQRVI